MSRYSSTPAKRRWLCMSQSFHEWMKETGDRLVENLRKAGCLPMRPPGEAALTPSVANPVADALNAKVQSRAVLYSDHVQVDAGDDLDHITQTCTHPGIAIVR